MIRTRHIINVLISSLVLWSSLPAEQVLKRGRNEGTAAIPASNVIGNGNITWFSGIMGSYGPSGPKVDPAIGLTLGVSDMMQLAGRMAFTNFTSLGMSEVHLQLTPPGNDRLRFLGLAFSVDLFLSTTVDTIGSTAATGKPEYNSFMLPSVIADLDWIALYKSFPLKTYLTIGMSDDPDLLFQYDQISAKMGFEWKTHRHGAFLDIGLGVYREKKHGTQAGDAAYSQTVVWLEPGVRYRLHQSWCFLASLRADVYERLKPVNPLPVTVLRAGAMIEIPLLFRETNTEAIRSLVFMDREKIHRKDPIKKNIGQRKQIKTGLENEFKEIEIKSGIPDVESEKESLKKREEIQEKMEQLEKLLEEDK